jgi:regulator of sigma E protease
MSFLAGLPIGWFALYVAVLILAIGIIVFIHEYGHFKVARLCGVPVETFSIGFGKEIAGFNDRYGTRWKICQLPFGGYVKFVGDVSGASGVPDLSEESRPKVPGDFHSQPVWKRALIVVAGPMANFISAIAFFALVYLFIVQTVSGPQIGALVAGEPAEKAGIAAGDIVRSIDGRSVSTFNDIVQIVSIRPGETLSIAVDRGGETRVFAVAAARHVEDGGFYGKKVIGRIGVGPSKDVANHVAVTPRVALSLAVNQTAFVFEATFRFLRKLFIGQESVDQLGGITTIARAAGDAAAEGIGPFIFIIGFLSVSIGLINLFPIPMLDGGHLVFYAIEAVRRKPLGPVAQEWSFRIGFAVVVMAMVFVNLNDIFKHFRD